MITIQHVRTALTAIGIDLSGVELTERTELQALGLDPLDLFELVSFIEDEIGKDPFRGAIDLSDTIGDVLCKFNRAEAAA